MIYFGIWMLIGFSIELGMYISAPYSHQNNLALIWKDYGFPFHGIVISIGGAIIWPYIVLWELRANL